MPEEWLREMGCNAAEEKHNGSCPAENQTAAEEPRTKNIVPKPKPKYYDDEYDSPNPTVNSLKSMTLAVLAALLASVAYYYISSRSAVLKPPSKGLSASTTIEASILDVFDYLSTPDFRTEWHFGAVEINGPAIDHSAITGEVFSEVLHISGKEHSVEWSIVDRQIPSSASSLHAQFAVEGIVSPGAPGRAGGGGEAWRETYRLRAGTHQHSRTPYVAVEVELEAAAARKDGGDAARRWRRQLIRALKASVALLRERLEERARAKAR